jgi:hypothetical protein
MKADPDVIAVKVCTMCGEKIRFWQDYMYHMEENFFYHNTCLRKFVAEYVTREIKATGGFLLGEEVDGWKP